jgi:hypothetical protein
MGRSLFSAARDGRSTGGCGAPLTVAYAAVIKRFVTFSAVFVSLAAPSTGQAARVCEYDPPPPRVSRAEQDLREAISKRKLWGLPHGRAFVRRVNASPAARRRGYAFLDFPMTKREAAYFRLRDRLTDEDEIRRLDEYLEGQPDTYSGLSIEDDYPNSPYLLIRFTGDLERHRQAIAGLYRLRFIVRQSDFTGRELERVYEAIEPGALRREGIQAVSWGIEGDRVRLDVTTPRPDAKEVVARLYGPAVAVTVLGPTRTFLACNSPETYRLGGDGRTLTLTFFHSGSIDPRRVELVERAGEVRVGVVIEVPHGPITADRVTYRLRVRLSRPLGRRVVRSIVTGRTVRPERR